MAQAELGFKKPLSKEEQMEKKKQRLAAIGNSLVVSSLSGLNITLFCVSLFYSFVLFTSVRSGGFSGERKKPTCFYCLVPTLSQPQLPPGHKR